MSSLLMERSEDLVGLFAAKKAVLASAQLDLGNAATRLFLHMALECWDFDDNPAGATPLRYFGRRELSAIALGYMAPTNATDAAFQAVKRATRELVSKGAITVIRRGGTGKPAEYELKVDVRHMRREGGGPVPLPFLAHEGATEWKTPGVSF
ncbi:hypothetical protein [Schumannella sp. 10F1B-5-1]|uniref:hypothetical protein n=1 Tax=Schumannella sp. 10F1B-5-1 TaxID=2590780 RepID=UPI001130F280|nr:hypothetical protein [Schumannella sp. 10F1B-5-1]TPW78409.1 hypothetical protein FJ658_00970 [Schumannella sp. 10F1B-5-1]